MTTTSPPSPWVQTRHGHAVDLLTPTANQIDVRDIAWSLARLNRYNGHTVTPLSVADHSVALAMYFIHNGYGTRAAMWALLHDAHEAYMGDLAAPLYAALSPSARAELKAIAFLLDEAILDRLWPRGVGWARPTEAERKLVSEADHRIVINERLVAFEAHEVTIPRPWSDSPWGPLFPMPERSLLSLSGGLTPSGSERLWLDFYAKLWAGTLC